MKFLKYGFYNPAAWDAAKAQITVTDEEGNETWDSTKVVAVVELGNICLQWGTDAEGNRVCEVESPMYAVDILWVDQPLASFDSSVVFPEPCGVHVFAGWEAQYAKDYCVANPSAAYCQPPTPPTNPS